MSIEFKPSDEEIEGSLDFLGKNIPPERTGSPKIVRSSTELSKATSEMVEADQAHAMETYLAKTKKEIKDAVEHVVLNFDKIFENLIRDNNTTRMEIENKIHDRVGNIIKELEIEENERHDRAIKKLEL